MKKICFIYSNIFSLGGIQRVITNIANYLSDEYDITIINLDSIRKKQKVNYGIKSKINIVDLGSDFSYYWYRVLKHFHILGDKNIEKNWEILRKQYNSKLEQLIKICNDEKLDSVFVAAPIDCMLIADVRNRIDYSCIYGWWHHCYKVYDKNYRQKFGKYFDDMFIKLDHVFVLSKNDQKIIKQKHNVNTTVLYNAIRGNNIEKSDLKNKKMLAVGRYNKIKGFDRVIEAYAKISDKINGWTIDIVGEGPEHDNLQKMIDKYRLSEKIILTGKTDNVEKYCKEASIFLMPSRDEGFGMTLIEAMSYGLPAVVCDTPVFHEMLPKDNIIVEQDNIDALADKMLMLASDFEKRKKYGDSNYNYVKKFSIDVIGEQWKEIIDNTKKSGSEDTL